MALVYGRGEITQRLRRFLDVRGKVALGLDENVVPVVLAEDASGPPYRGDGYKCAGTLTMAAVATDIGVIDLHNLSTGPFVLDRFWASISTATRVRVGFPGLAATAAGTVLLTGENTPGPASPGLAAPLRLQPFGGQIAVTLATPFLDFVGTTGDGGIGADLGFVVPPRTVLRFETTAINQLFIVTVVGRTFAYPGL